MHLEVERVLSQSEISSPLSHHLVVWSDDKYGLSLVGPSAIAENNKNFKFFSSDPISELVVTNDCLQQGLDSWSLQGRLSYKGEKLNEG